MRVAVSVATVLTAVVVIDTLVVSVATVLLCW